MSKIVKDIEDNVDKAGLGKVGKLKLFLVVLQKPKILL